MQQLTKEQIAERERIANEIIDDILNEAGIEELQGLTLEERGFHDDEHPILGRESIKDFLSRAHNYQAAAILLEIYLRVRSRREP